jgi:hypothetical protein
MVRHGDCGRLPQSDGSIMRRFLVIAVAGAGLAGCSSFSLDAFKSAPPTVQLQLDSMPPGADAKTSVGPGCTTPCSVAVPAADAGFSVTFSKDKFLPVTIPVQVVNVPGDFSTPASTSIDPNPVVAELKPAGPPPKAARKPIRPKKPKPPKSAAAAPAATAPADAGSPFPAPPPPAPTQ